LAPACVHRGGKQAGGAGAGDDLGPAAAAKLIAIATRGLSCARIREEPRRLGLRGGVRLDALLVRTILVPGRVEVMTTRCSPVMT
jgi:hypothetical protein